MNAIFRNLRVNEVHSSDFSAEFSINAARQRGLLRMLQALFREGLLQKEHLITEGSLAWLPLWSQQALLRFEGLHIGRIGDCQLSGAITFYKTGERPKPVPTSSILLARIMDALPTGVASDFQRLIQELENSIENDALCLNYRRQWAQRIVEECGRDRYAFFLSALRDEVFPNSALFLEQWGTLGHPWHPTYKTKLGLTAQEVVALSPEFQAQLSIPVAAIRSELMHTEACNGGTDYRYWFATTFPQVWQKWEAALAQIHPDTHAWLPLPVHPYQAERLIPTEFAKEIADGNLLLLPGVDISASPTMSFRTVVPERSDQLPHIKLPVSLRLTSVQRTVSPKSAVMGPRSTRLLRTIVAHERGFDGALDVLGEEIGLHYLDPDRNDDRARHLSALFRANPMSKRSDTLFPVPVGALFADSPFNGRPLVTDLTSLSYGDHPEGAIAFFERYAETVLTATLSAYLLYGIAFEAHQQNSFIMVDQQYAPVQLLVRDFGDLRIHAPTLRRSGLDLVAYRSGHTMFESEETVRDKLLHAVMLCHLSELALLLARTYNQPSDHFWNVLRRETENAFDRLRSRTSAQRWESERRALLEADWPAKSFLRMRLSDTSDDVHGSMPNPLR